MTARTRGPARGMVAVVQARRRSNAAGTHDPRPKRERTRAQRRRAAITRSADDR